MSTNIDFQKKYKEYGEMLYRIAFVYLGNPDDTEDILQEVFITLLYNSPEFKSKEHEKAWLIRITQNKCINFLKSSSRKTLTIDEIKKLGKSPALSVKPGTPADAVFPYLDKIDMVRLQQFLEMMFP